MNDLSVENCDFSWQQWQQFNYQRIVTYLSRRYSRIPELWDNQGDLPGLDEADP